MKTFVLMIAIFMDFVLIVKFKMRLITGLFCFGLELYAFYSFSKVGFYSLFFCFLIIGILKSIRKYFEKISDVQTYKISNFLYSAGIPIFLCLLEAHMNHFSIIENNKHRIHLLIICSIASIISDTSASEMGQLYKGKTYSIIGLLPVDAGEDGGVSMMGTLSSMLVTFLFVALMSTYANYQEREFAVVYAFSIVSCFLDSLLGATIQKQGIISNEQTNLFSIIFTLSLIILV